MQPRSAGRPAAGGPAGHRRHRRTHAADLTDEGIRAALAVRIDHPGQPVLVLSQYIANAYAESLLESSADGGVGYLLKDRVGQVDEFLDAVVRVAAGGCVIDAEVVRQLLARRRDPLARLTPREREVLSLMAEGKASRVVAGPGLLSAAPDRPMRR